MKVWKMNENYNNVWMSIRLLVNEYLKMNGKYENESLEFGAQIRWIQKQPG